MPQSVCASLLSPLFFVKALMNVPIDGFLFQQALQEKEVPPIVVL